MTHAADMPTLVQRAAELRAKLEGRLPERIYWGWKDFLVGTAGMPVEALGVYVRLLHYQLDKGSVPAHDGKRWVACGGCTHAAFSDAWDKYVQYKFHEHDGAYYNVRALQEFIAAGEALIGKRERGRAGGKRSAELRKEPEPF